MNFKSITARFFTVTLNPLLMSFYSVIMLWTYSHFFYYFEGQEWKVIINVLLFTFIVPGLFIAVMRGFRLISSFDMPERKERVMPLFVSLLSNMSLVYFFYGINVQIWFLGLISAPVLVHLLAIVINFFWKISVHMMGIGGLLGAMMAICFNVNKQNPFLLFMVLFIFAGCLGVSLLYQKRHTHGQIYAGFAIGFVAAYLVVWASVYFVMTV
ncbi:membrane-associated phospholipid phosphatase [Dysgonomonas sp. PH5-45]|uniref:hypothetical protein n=1 Tax=unclassified Dysgonomonas TaxID=2630389 RepID=UPI00247542D6|nr:MULTISPECIES: hypothetical protein [unclassified Dysgonomonas]MDH6355524.1 membrane-associated phospholipid phosphatase [Dysgonomonas sp. PH5-45]MDH6388415.1 membrane-associated phospholipid phosphatase [Dysgonomonas sp. PH5-37]